MRFGFILALGLGLTLGGCSFINDWGTFTTDPTVDAGMRDAGGGVDSGPPCDRCGGGCPSGEFCSYSDTEACRVCMPGEGNPEGGSCADSSECESDLDCELGICTIQCDDGGDCAGSVLGRQCVDAGSGGFCLDPQCDPVFPGDCAPASCQPIGVSTDGELITVCADPLADIRFEGDGCEFFNQCEEGTLCIDPEAAGTSTCIRTCFTDDSTTCPTGSECIGFGNPARPNTSYMSREVGICYTLPCTSDTDCAATVGGTAPACIVGECWSAESFCDEYQVNCDFLPGATDRYESWDRCVAVMQGMTRARYECAVDSLLMAPTDPATYCLAATGQGTCS